MPSDLRSDDDLRRLDLFPRDAPPQRLCVRAWASADWPHHIAVYVGTEGDEHGFRYMWVDKEGKKLEGAPQGRERELPTPVVNVSGDPRNALWLTDERERFYK